MNTITKTLAGTALTLGFVAGGGLAAQAAPAAPAAADAICGESYAENSYYVRINNCTNMQMMTTVHYKDGRTTHLHVSPYSFQRLLSDVTASIDLDYYYM